MNKQKYFRCRICFTTKAKDAKEVEEELNHIADNIYAKNGLKDLSLDFWEGEI
jgi:hypothetical protein